MREEQPCHNVRIVGIGQVTSEPQNKSVLNLMKCPPTPTSLSPPPEQARFLNMGSVSWGGGQLGVSGLEGLPLSVSDRFTVNLILYEETDGATSSHAVMGKWCMLLKLKLNCH